LADRVRCQAGAGDDPRPGSSEARVGRPLDCGTPKARQPPRSGACGALDQTDSPRCLVKSDWGNAIDQTKLTRCLVRSDRERWFGVGVFFFVHRSDLTRLRWSGRSFSLFSPADSLQSDLRSRSGKTAQRHEYGRQQIHEGDPITASTFDAICSSFFFRSCTFKAI
jgi:hypothetical protein